MLTTNKGKSQEAQKHKRKNDGKSSGHYREEDWKKRREDQGRIGVKGGQVKMKENMDFTGFRHRPITAMGNSSLEAQNYKGKSSGHYREEEWMKRREDQGRIREKGGQVNVKKNRDFMGFRCRPNPAMSSDSGGIQVWAKGNLNRDNEL